MKFIRSLSITGAAFGLLAGSAVSQMASHGPVSADSFGFPETYTDQAGTTLVQGVDITDPLLLAILEAPNLPDPTGPLDVGTGNFFGEFFYWAGDTTIGTAGGDALLVMALEGVFDNAAEAIIEGDQLVFSRIRIRIDVGNDPANAGTYTVIHPFGEVEFEVTAADIAANGGTRVINYTDDCLHLNILNPSCGVAMGNQFTNVMDPSIASISHFLAWDADAPAGYIGDPNIGHTVTGSPTGNNFFRVEGPNIGIGAVGSEIADDDAIQTSLFSVSGKLAPEVLNAWVDLGGGLTGSGLQPVMTGTGDLTPGSEFSVQVSTDSPLTPGIMFFGTQAGNIPFAGGIVVPDPTTGFRRNRITNAAGTVGFGGIFPAIAPGTELYVQYWLQDAGAPGNFAGSNAILGTVP